MQRRLALLVSLAVAGVMPALAQTPSHPPHPQGGTHDPAAHMPVDPAVHAAIHAQLFGSWSGTVASTEGSPIPVTLTVATDKDGKTTVQMSTDRPMKVGAASDIAIDAKGLHWTQMISDASCKATAALEAGDVTNHHATETMKGTLTCERGEIAFTLHRIKG